MSQNEIYAILKRHRYHPPQFMQHGIIQSETTIPCCCWDCRQRRHFTRQMLQRCGECEPLYICSIFSALLHGNCVQMQKPIDRIGVKTDNKWYTYSVCYIIAVCACVQCTESIVNIEKGKFTEPTRRFHPSTKPNTRSDFRLVAFKKFKYNSFGISFGTCYFPFSIQNGCYVCVFCF